MAGLRSHVGGTFPRSLDDALSNFRKLVFFDYPKFVLFQTLRGLDDCLLLYHDELTCTLDQVVVKSVENLQRNVLGQKLNVRTLPVLPYGLSNPLFDSGFDTFRCQLVFYQLFHLFPGQTRRQDLALESVH